MHAADRLTEASSVTRILTRLAENRVIRNNAIFLSGSIGAGVCGYIFHFAVGRLLGPAQYGVVASAIAALYLLTLPALVVQTVSMRFTSVFAARNDLGPIKQLLSRGIKVNLAIGGIAAVVILGKGRAVAAFLQLPDQRIVAILAVATVLGLLISANRGALQGLRRFGALSLNLMLDMALRLLIAIVLIALGFGVIGALFGVLLGSTAAYGLTFILLRGVGHSNSGNEVSLGEVGRYALPTTVAVMGVTYLMNIDVILAKHYLPADAAGLYAAAAILGRVVYFLGLTIAGVMFPEVATLHARDQAHFHVVDLSMLFLAGVGTGLLGAYVLAPGLVLLPYGNGFIGVKSYLAPFAVALMLLALANLLVNYFLSVNSSRFIPILVGACVLETLLIASFHDGAARILSMLLLTAVTLSLALGVLYGAERLRKARPSAMEARS